MNTTTEIDALTTARSALVISKDHIDMSGHHYADVMSDDLGAAIDNIGNVIDALEDIRNGAL